MSGRRVKSLRREYFARFGRMARGAFTESFPLIRWLAGKLTGHKTPIRHNSEWRRWKKDYYLGA